MTGRTLRIAAGAALTVAVLAVAVRPILGVGHHGVPPIPPASTTTTATVGVLGAAAARTDLRCPPLTLRSGPVVRPVDCGTLRITRRQTTCAAATRCTVELIGTLDADGRPVPVALTVTVRGSGSGWHVTEVAS